MDENMKESVKITVIAAGFREAARRQPHQKPAFLPQAPGVPRRRKNR